MILIYVTFPSKEEATKVVRELLDKKLVKCATFFPVESMYLWEGNLKNEEEYVALLKSSKEFDVVSSEIEKLHSYDVPCILKMDAECNKKFGKWVEEKK